MEEIQLNVQMRNATGTRKIRGIRRESFVPAVVYGGNKKSCPITVDRRTYNRIRRTHYGENMILHLNVLEGEDKREDSMVILKEEQRDPVSEDVIHIDFKRISLKEKLEIKVPLVAKGEPLGVKRDGGSLEHVLWELEVVCLPTNIPQRIEIEVSHMVIGDTIHVRDIQLPEGVTTKQDPEAIIFSVVPPMKEEVAPTPEAAAATEPEVIKEKKEVEGEGEAAPAKEEPKKEKDVKKEEKGK
jgi:large subunit ribosomal protein L25